MSLPLLTNRDEARGPKALHAAKSEKFRHAEPRLLRGESYSNILTQRMDRLSGDVGCETFA